MTDLIKEVSRPHIDQTRFKGIEGPEYKVASSCAVPGCINPRNDKHHAWSRTHIRKRGGGGWDWVQDIQTGDQIKNIIPLCFQHHADLHEARARLYYDPFIKGFYWSKKTYSADGVPDDAPLKYEWALLPDHHANPSPEPRSSYADGVVVGEQRHEQDEAPQVVPPPSGAVAPTAAPHIHPGETCPTCERKVPHPRKPTSPKSKTKSFRLPVDVAGDYDELVEAAAKHLGIEKEPFAHFNAVNAGLVLVLRSEPGLLAKDAA